MCDSLFYQFMIGLATIVTMWPVFIVLHGLNIKSFELPKNQTECISVLIPMMMDLVGAALLYSGISLTSALLVTMASPFAIPLTYFVDIVFRNEKHFGVMTTCGTLLIIVGFIFVEIPFRNLKLNCCKQILKKENRKDHKSTRKETIQLYQL